jgi:hypothetical protein
MYRRGVVAMATALPHIVDVPVIVGTTQGRDGIGRASPGHPADWEDGTVEDEETSNPVIWLRYRSINAQAGLKRRLM